MNKVFAVLLVGSAALLGSGAAAQAGCLTGAAVGGAVGHVAGHHGVVGAAVGCAIGHHRTVERRREEERTGADRDMYGRDAYRDDDHR